MVILIFASIFSAIALVASIVISTRRNSTSRHLGLGADSSGSTSSPDPAVMVDSACSDSAIDSASCDGGGDGGGSN